MGVCYNSYDKLIGAGQDLVVQLGTSHLIDGHRTIAVEQQAYNYKIKGGLCSTSSQRESFFISES